MNNSLRSLASLIFLAASLISSVVRAEDIDIFMNRSADSSLPNVIFVLDNTANWSRQSQGWPGGVVQGQSEVQAIRNALSKQVGKVNVGLFEFRTGDCVDCGYVRFALQPFTESSKTTFNAVVDRIYQNINEPVEKRNSGASYGDLMLDLYNYLAGRASLRSGAGTPSLADSSGYQTNYSQFKSPLSSANLCGRTSIIFIGNPQLSGPTADSSANSAALKLLYQGLGGNPDRLADDFSGVPLALPEISTVVTTKTEELGFSKQCYSTKNNDLATSRAACAVDESVPTGLCAGKEGCGCSEVGGLDCSVNNTARFKVSDTQTEVVTSETGRLDTVSGAAWNLDDWAKYFNNYGIPVIFSSSGGEVTERHSVSLYAIDVYNKQPNAQHSGLLYSAALNGGGRYFAARNEAAIQLAIEGALSDIISVSSAFSGVALPLSSTTQSRSENQIYVGMFRPDKLARPRWFGNLKRYELGLVNGVVEMVDIKGKPISNRLSGYISECAESYWTADSGNYWESLGITPPPKGQCISADDKQWSDLPDGPFVEKGGTGQRLRARSTARILKTVGASGLVDFDTTNTTSIGGQQVYDYFIGIKGGSSEILPASGLRASVHGDVVHSRPVAVNYGNGKTIAYYGANDGLFRAVDGSNGNEQWALVVPEHFSKLKRLFDNTPLVAFPNQDSAATPKDYFFDGSTGQLLTRNANGTVAQAWIFPTMRRGGRMVYALDVTNPESPSLLWRHGCLSEDNCTNDNFSDIGQTWSMPVAARIKNAAGEPVQVVIFGGGYDACEDNKTLSASCPSPQGASVYVLHARTGEVLAKFATERSVAADVAVVDVDNDGFDDYAYAADTGGTVWRVSLAQPTATLSLNNSGRIAKAAYTANSNRKFLQAPALTAFKGDVFVALGSGNRERPLITDYPYQSNVDDRFYVFRDRPSGPSLINLDSSSVTNADDASVQCEGASILPGKGWYKLLPGRGEQVANPAAIVGGDVFFNTYQPVGAKAGMCSNQLGLGTGYRLSLFNGSACGRTPTLMPDGMPTAPIVTTVEVSCGVGCTKVVTVVVGEGGTTGTAEIKLAIDPVRSIDYWTNETDN